MRLALIGADETPEQRVLRKEQERKIIKKKEVRSSRSRREERSRRESQVEKKDEDDETIEQEVISIPAGEWSALSDAMLLSRKYFFLKVVREDNDAGVHDMMGHFKQIVKKSQGSKASPFNGHKWYERFLITLGNLENTRECDIMIKCKVPLEEVKFEEAQAMAEGLQICMKKTWNAEKALKMWYDFYPQMQPMKEVIWFKVVTRIMINALICEFRYSPLVFKLMLLLLVFMVSFGQQSQDERCSSYFSCTYLGNAEAQQQADWDNNNND